MEFDTPVRIALRKPQGPTVVWTVIEAADCLRSESWPTRNKPFTRIADKALEAAKAGYLTAAEAREVFMDAALEAHVLVSGPVKH